MRGGLLFLDAFRGAEAVGLYAVAARVGDLLLLMPNIATAVILAKLSGIGDAKERHADTVRLARWLTAGVAALSMIVVSAGPVLVPLLFGPAFARSYTPLSLLLPGLVCWTLRSCSSSTWPHTNPGRLRDDYPLMVGLSPDLPARSLWSMLASCLRRCLRSTASNDGRDQT